MAVANEMKEWGRNIERMACIGVGGTNIGEDFILEDSFGRKGGEGERHKREGTRELITQNILPLPPP